MNRDASVATPTGESEERPATGRRSAAGRTTRRRFLAATGAAVAFAGAGSAAAAADRAAQVEAQAGDEQVIFAVRIENVSTDETLMPSEGEAQAVPLSPGVYAVHTEPAPLFAAGEPDRGEGLERIAEDGDPTDLAAALADREGVTQSGAFDTAVEAAEPGPIGPGAAYEFTFTAMPGDRLSFATMFVPSNDLFYAPDAAGIALFSDAGEAAEGDVTDQVALWDAGTEVNEEPGVGPNQVQRQEGPDTGTEEGATVRQISEVDDGFSYPAVADVIRVTVEPVTTAPMPTDNETAANETAPPAGNETAANATAENETAMAAGNETAGNETAGNETA